MKKSTLRKKRTGFLPAAADLLPALEPRYRVIKTKDHSAVGAFSWCVFDARTTDRGGNFEYIADCINAKAARLIADALNAYMPPKKSTSPTALRAQIAPRTRSRGCTS